MSVNAKASCATCHNRNWLSRMASPWAWARPGRKHPRGAMSLVNVAYSGRLTWNNPDMRRPGGPGAGADVRRASRGVGIAGGRWFSADAAFRCEIPGLVRAARFRTSRIRSPLRTSSRRSPVSSAALSRQDRPMTAIITMRDDAAISESAKRGEILFFDSRLSCFRCHGGFNFSGGEESPQHGRFHRRSRKVQSAQPAQHRRYRALHARRQHGDAGCRSGPLLLRWQVRQRGQRPADSRLQIVAGRPTGFDLRSCNR